MIKDLIKELRIKDSWNSNLLPDVICQNSIMISQGSYNAVRRWLKKIDERLPIATERGRRNLIALVR